MGLPRTVVEAFYDQGVTGEILQNFNFENLKEKFPLNTGQARRMMYSMDELLAAEKQLPGKEQIDARGNCNNDDTGLKLKTRAQSWSWSILDPCCGF